MYIFKFLKYYDSQSQRWHGWGGKGVDFNEVLGLEEKGEKVEKRRGGGKERI